MDQPREKPREIAKIEDAFLGYEDHGILTIILTLRYGGGSGQGAGMYALDQYDEDAGHRVGHRSLGDFVIGVLRATGSRNWSEVEGKTVFAIKDSDSYGARVIGIEPLPTEPGERFMFDEVKRGDE